MKNAKATQTEIFKEDINYLSQKYSNKIQLKNKKILITGATGLIGKTLVYSLMKLNELYNFNIQVIATARNIEKAKVIFDQFIGKSGFSIQNLDVTKKINNSDFPDSIDILIHAAANTNSADMAHDPLGMIDSVFSGTQKVLEFAKDKHVSNFIYLSSMEIYGTTNKSDGVITEEFYGKIPLDSTRSSYPEAKRLAELLVLSYGKEFGFKTITLRPTQVLGSGVNIDDPRVFAEFTRQAINNHKIVMKTEGKTVRSYIYIRDMIDCILHCIVDIDKSNIFNVSNEIATISIAKMAKEIAEIVGETQVIVDSSDVEKRGFAPELQMELSSDKLIQTGWKPTVGMHEMLKRLVMSFIEQI